MIDTRKIQLNESIVIDTTVDIAMPKGFEATDTAVSVVGKLKNTGSNAFALDAMAECRLELACSLCLQPVAQRLSFHINENYAEAQDAADEDIAFSDYTIDIYPAVQRNLFLNIPMKPLCDDDCAGLCPQCGTNLNKTDCNCEGDIVNEQFRDLLQMFED